MPVLFAAQLGKHRVDDRREHRRDHVQGASQRAGRHVQPVVAQVLQQAMTRSAVQVLVQQHASPHRDAELAALDQPAWGRRTHDPGHAAALAAGSVTAAADQATIGLDLDLQYLAVLGAGEFGQRLTTRRALRRVKPDGLDTFGQMSQHLAPVAWCTAALSAAGRLESGLGPEFAGAFAALALAAKQTLLQITDLGMRLVELSKKRRLALPGRFLRQRQCRVPRRLALLGVLAQFHHESPGAVLELLQAPHRSLMQRLPTPGLHHQLDVLQLGQPHVHLGKRRRARPAYRRDRIQLNGHRFHGSARYGKKFTVSSDFGAATNRTYGSTECLPCWPLDGR